jgi:Ca2+-binding EF-hand superfamily protein
MSVGLANRMSIPQFISQADFSGSAKFLSPFQIEKLTYFFHAFFDNDKNGVIEIDDFEGLNERLRNIAGWSMDSSEYKLMLDNFSVLFECLLDQVKNEADNTDLEHRTWEEALKPTKFNISSINLTQWLNMWGRLCKGASGIDQMPVWVRLIPTTIFMVIDSKDGHGIISQEEVKRFYAGFTGMRDTELDETAKEGFRAMTANGEHKLTLDNFKLLFSNFILGKTIYGPGKYIFGIFDNSDMNQKYQVLYEEE